MSGTYSLEKKANPLYLPWIKFLSLYHSGEDIMEQPLPAKKVLLSVLAQRWEQHHPGEDFFAPFDLPEKQ